MLLRANVKITHPVLPNPGLNTWHFRIDTENPVLGDVAGVVNMLHDFYDALLTDVLAQGAQFAYDGVMTTVEAEPRAFGGLGPWTSGNAGSSATLPPANCLVIGWTTGTATRNGRGRTFLGPIQQAANDATGTVSTGALAAARAQAANLVADSQAAANGAIGVYSRSENLLRDITGAVVHDKFAVLRSRRD